MYRLLNIILLVWISIIKLTVGLIDIQSIDDDLRGKQVCDLDDCSRPLNGTELFVGCHCDENCARIGTCCLDSPYIQLPRPKLKAKCTYPHHGKAYYMVDHCPTNDSIWEGLCRDPNPHTVENDFLGIVPVTSLLTSVTYKNYFCFKCHEINDEFIYWKLKFVYFISDGEVESMTSEEMQYDFEKQMFNVTYNDGDWRASFRNGLVSFNLWLKIEVPEEIRPLVRLCTYMISSCSTEWTDPEVSKKCQAYMQVRDVKKGHYVKRYKNIHCALCNFEDLNNTECVNTDHFIERDPSGKMYFSFSHLLDINNADGDKVGKVQKCDDDHIWDRFAGTCRKLTCAFPGYKIRNGKCQPQ